MASFQGNLPIDTPIGAPATSVATASSKKSFNIMGKDSFKKIMNKGYFYQQQQISSHRQSQS